MKRGPSNRVIDGLWPRPAMCSHNMAKDYNPAPQHGWVEHPECQQNFQDPRRRGSLRADSANPNSENRPFLHHFKDNDFLNGQYTVYGQVISGMEHVDAYCKGRANRQPDRMISVRCRRGVSATRRRAGCYPSRRLRLCIGSRDRGRRRSQWHDTVDLLKMSRPACRRRSLRWRAVGRYAAVVFHAYRRLHGANGEL